MAQKPSVQHTFVTVLDALRFRAKHEPHANVFTFLTNQLQEQSNITYSELYRRAARLAADIRRHCSAGDRVLVMYRDGADYNVAIFACLCAGAIAVPVPPPRVNRSPSRIRTIVRDAGARVALTSPDLAERMRSQPDSPELHQMQWLPRQESLGENLYCHAAAPSDAAFIQYTSGTTSEPRGVIVTHANLAANLASLASLTNIVPGSNTVTWLPPYHDMGLVGGIFLPVYAGFRAIAFSPATFIQKPARWLQLISKYAAVASAAHDSAYDLCARDIAAGDLQGVDLSSWQIAFEASEPVRQETIEKFCRAFSPYGFSRQSFFPCYGLAESTLLVTGWKKQPEPLIRWFDAGLLAQRRVEKRTSGNGRPLVACGMPDNHHRILIVDPDSRLACGPGQVGEIWCSGPSVAPGYWGKQEESAHVFQAQLANGGGPYLRTGDLGFLENGQLFVTGRIKELILIRGRNTYPQDVELATLRSHHLLGRNSCAAFSVEYAGSERLVIAAELDRLTTANDHAELQNAIRMSVTREFDIEPWAILLLRKGSIPRTSSGKIQRFACRSGFLRGVLAPVSEWRQPHRAPHPALIADPPRNVHEWLIQAIAARADLHKSAIDPAQPFSAYGLDSVASVQLARELEQYCGRSVSPTLAYEYPTIDAMARYLSGQGVAPTSEPGGCDSAEPVAIVGMACRFPGAPDTSSFWDLLRNARDAVTHLPRNRWTGPSADTAPMGGFLHDVAGFDAAFFAISSDEAKAMDPQQRLLLELAWEAFEDAGQNVHRLAGSRTAVFAGISTNDYSRLISSHGPSNNIFVTTGNAFSIAANRISYQFDFRGPSIAVDTACSSSLVAVHLGLTCLRKNEADLVVAGGVNCLLLPDITASFAQAGVISANGHCKAFDAAADGIVRGEGGGLVILKPLARALADGDRIYCVIAGGALGQDGKTNGIAAPNREAHERLLRDAYRDSKLAPSCVQYVEAHGTGTLLGDPIELRALGNVIGLGRTEPLLVGSVKTNLGHLEAAAGIAGLIKTSLSLYHRQIPPSLHFTSPNPHVDFDAVGIRVQQSLTPWPDRGALARAGVTALGFGGANAHLVLEQAPPHSTQVPRTGPYLLCISAMTRDALNQLAARYATLVSAIDDVDLLQTCAAAALRRAHLTYKLAILGESAAGLRTRLQSFVNGESGHGIHLGNGTHRKPRIVFVYSAYGSGDTPSDGLFTFPDFARTMRECDAWARAEASCALIGEPAALDSSNALARGQLTILALQMSLTSLWRSWGIGPDAVLGYSLGEIAAAWASGAITLPAAMTIAYERSTLFQNALRTTPGGGMLIVRLSQAKAEELLEPFAGRAAIAAVNSPEQVVLTAPHGDIESLMRALDRQRIAFRRLDVPGQGHSPELLQLGRELASRLTGLHLEKAQAVFYSGMRGGEMAAGELTAEYWASHMVNSIQFSGAVMSAATAGYDLFLEIGPDAVLKSSIAQTLKSSGANAHRGCVLSSLIRSRDCTHTMLEALAEIYVRGGGVDWSAVFGTVPHTPLPSYPWQRQHYWIEAAHPSQQPLSSSTHPLLQQHIEMASHPDSELWDSQLEAHQIATFADHRIRSVPLMPSAAFIEIALAVSGTDSVESLQIHTALFLPPEGPLRLQVHREPVGTGEAHIQISSNRGGVWEANASARIGGTGTCRAPIRFNPVEVRSRCPNETSASDFYLELELAGVNYATSFQGVKRVWRGDRESLAEVEAPPSIEPEMPRYRFHPALLDACLQAFIAASRLVRSANRAHTFLPVAIREFWLLGRPPRKLFSHARVVAENLDEGSFEGDLTIADESGSMVAEISGFQVRRADDFASEDPNLFLELRWDASRKSPADQTEATVSDLWCVVRDGNRMGECILARLQQAGCNCLDMPCRSQLEDPAEIITPAISRLGIDCRSINVVYLTGLNALIADDTSPSDLELLVSRHCIALTTLLKGLARLPLPVHVWVVTRGAQPVRPNDSLSLAQAPLWGMCRTLAEERPQGWRAIIDLDAGAKPEDDAALLCAELLAPGNETQIAFRNGVRYVARLVPKRLAPVDHPLRFQPSGAYLITGGLGDLGLLLARSIVEQGARHLILLNRSGLPSRAQWSSTHLTNRINQRIRQLVALESMGASIHVVEADAGDEASLAAFLTRYEQELRPPLRGVFHLAGSVEGAGLLELTETSLRNQLHGKACGSWVLHRLLKDRALDFFVLYSSASSMIGSPLLGGYAAANAFLDALAHHRRAQGLNAAAINWGFWSESGMAARAQLEYGGGAITSLRGFGNRKGIQMLKQVLLSQSCQVIAMPFAWQTFAERHPAAAANPLFSELIRPLRDLHDRVPLPTLETLLAVTPAKREEKIAASLAASLASFLGLPLEDIKTDQPLMTLGVDSLAAVELKNQVETAWRVQLPIVHFLQRPTLQHLAKLISERLPGWASPPAIPKAQLPFDARATLAHPASALAQIDRFSDEQVASMLSFLTTGEKVY
jgi:acyl transferase domain-containing protein/acyl-CoA synthetase (AMP-forming)/AMP-acid ligase II/acyl carrier protein